MKKLVLVLVMIFLVMVGRTQSFEGVIKWNMKMEITDPKAKAQMEEAKKKANDPANQAKIKEMQAKMNDPQFKAMMESNPQMKAQVETLMKAVAGADMSAMLPTGIIVKLKGANLLVSIQGGFMDKNDILHIADKNVTYTVNHPTKSYMLMKSQDNSQQQQQPKVTKTSETTKILNYTCTKYIIETTAPDGKVTTTNYWATTEIKDIDLKALAKQQMGKDQTFIYPQVDGVPLKIEAMMPQETMTMEVTEFKKEGLPASTFVLPAGYTETKI